MSPPIRRILAATDFSELASIALDRAARLAARHEAELLLVHALQRGDWLERLAGELAGAGGRSLFEASLAALEAESRRLSGVAGTLRFEVLEQPLHRALPDLLAAHPADLLVMGASGGGGWQDALLGSTADRVLRQHRLPVLLVRRAAAADYTRVALATDFSEASDAAARFALGLTPAAVHLLLHALEPPFDSSLAFAGVAPEAREEYLAKAAQQAMADLDAFAHRIGGDAVRAVPALREGRPSRVLGSFVRDAEIDLVALGVAGRSRIERGLLGSVSRHAASSLPCDVLLVPQPQPAD
jgi:nucleotide-binding universal stress UspA family protein